MRPDGRPWTNVRSQEEYREAISAGYTPDSIKLDFDSVRDSAYAAGWAAGSQAAASSPTPAAPVASSEPIVAPRGAPLDADAIFGRRARDVEAARSGA